MNEEQKMTIHVDGITIDQILERLSNLVEQQVRMQMSAKVKDSIDVHVAKIVEEVTRERIFREANALLEEGWKQTDSYGEPTGKVFTLRERVRGIFDGKDRNGYDRLTMIEQWLKNAVERDLAKVLTEETELVRKQLKAAFDDVVKAKFAETLRKSLGLG